MQIQNDKLAFSYNRSGYRGNTQQSYTILDPSGNGSGQYVVGIENKYAGKQPKYTTLGGNAEAIELLGWNSKELQIDIRAEGSFSLSIRDLSGKKVVFKSVQGPTTFQLPRSSVQKGIYYMSLIRDSRFYAEREMMVF